MVNDYKIPPLQKSIKCFNSCMETRWTAPVLLCDGESDVVSSSPQRMPFSPLYGDVYQGWTIKSSSSSDFQQVFLWVKVLWDVREEAYYQDAAAWWPGKVASGCSFADGVSEQFDSAALLFNNPKLLRTVSFPVLPRKRPSFSWCISSPSTGLIGWLCSTGT